MEIIPVIDIMGGKVVRANSGNREHYPLLQSQLTNSCDPKQLISDLLEWYPFTKIYIADLDAIANQRRNHALYKSITQKFPEVIFWLDAGIRTQQCWQQFGTYLTIMPVIGSETLLDSECLLNDKVREGSVLSLDFKKGIFLGQAQLLKQTDLWTAQVIMMDLDNVGGKSGSDLNRILALKQRSLHSQLIAAGGIKDKRDLMRLENNGIKHALVASALHDGTLSNSEIEQIR